MQRQRDYNAEKDRDGGADLDVSVEGDGDVVGAEESSYLMGHHGGLGACKRPPDCHYILQLPLIFLPVPPARYYLKACKINLMPGFCKHMLGEP